MKKSWFSIIFAKNSLAKNYRRRKFRHRSIKKLPVQLSKRQTDPTNAFVKIERQSKETVGTSNLFQKKSKISVFLTKTGRKKIGKK